MIEQETLKSPLSDRQIVDAIKTREAVGGHRFAGYGRYVDLTEPERDTLVRLAEQGLAAQEHALLQGELNKEAMRRMNEAVEALEKAAGVTT